MPLDRRATIAGFLGAIAALGTLAYLVGVGDLLRSLSMARTTVAAGVLVVAVVWMTAWALALRTVLGALGAGVSRVQATAVYAGVLFANNVTPFGQAGGEPISALLISEVADTEYETALAAIASADSLNFVPSTAIGLVGVTYFSVTVAVGDRLRWAAAAVAGLAVALPALGYLGWRYRDRVEAAIVGLLAPVVVPRFVVRHGLAEQVVSEFGPHAVGVVVLIGTRLFIHVVGVLAVPAWILVGRTLTPGTLATASLRTADAIDRDDTPPGKSTRSKLCCSYGRGDVDERRRHRGEQFAIGRFSRRYLFPLLLQLCPQWWPTTTSSGCSTSMERSSTSSSATRGRS